MQTFGSLNNEALSVVQMRKDGAGFFYLLLRHHRTVLLAIPSKKRKIAVSVEVNCWSQSKIRQMLRFVSTLRNRKILWGQYERSFATLETLGDLHTPFCIR